MPAPSIKFFLPEPDVEKHLECAMLSFNKLAMELQLNATQLHLCPHPLDQSNPGTPSTFCHLDHTTTMEESSKEDWPLAMMSPSIHSLWDEILHPTIFGPTHWLLEEISLGHLDLFFPMDHLMASLPLVSLVDP